MSSIEIAEEIRAALPDVEEPIVQYLSGYLVDDAGEEEDVLLVSHNILASLGIIEEPVVQRLMGRLEELVLHRIHERSEDKTRPKLIKLDKVMNMSKTGALSHTIAFGEGVDLESVNKGKSVRRQFENGMRIVDPLLELPGSM